MSTIRLYKIHSGFSNRTNQWSLFCTDMVATNGDYSQIFVLPPGYGMGETTFGDRGIFNADGRYSELSVMLSGCPCLIDYEVTPAGVPTGRSVRTRLNMLGTPASAT